MHDCRDRLCRVPPSPDVMALLYMEYRRSEFFKRISFAKYLEKIGFVDPSKDITGMDDRVRFRAGPDAAPQLIDIPSQPVTGQVRVKVLLVEFSDRKGVLPASHYEDLLFSNAKYPTGSMRDFYREVSRGKVTVSGSVHGWLTMPQPYSFYANGESGMKARSYPNNAQRLAEDAVKAAMQAGVTFEKQLDKFNQGIITALFIVHAGRGAEVLAPQIAGAEIWSHKWAMRKPVQITPELAATLYLVVPNDCKVGVCSHELGHLAFQWQDFYDPNYAEDGSAWDGSGKWDLMAGGSYNGNGAVPAHPAGLHKLQHGWISAKTVTSTRTLTVRPQTKTSGTIYKVVSPTYKPNQYLLLEARKRAGFDFRLPGEGLLVWKVDESGVQEVADKAGLKLIQADGRRDLENPSDWNDGDGGDPFPGTARTSKLRDSLATSFDRRSSGISLENIARDTATGNITLTVRFAPPGPAGSRKKAAKKARRRKPR